MDDIEVFTSCFRGDQRGAAGPWTPPGLMEVPSYQAFARRLAGKSFDGGLYRFHDGISGPRLASALSAGFPAFAERAVPFAFDWLGRQFAIDRARMEQGEPLILLIEPGTGEALEIPFAFAAFHRELDSLREPALAEGFFREWSAANPGNLPLPFTSCVGYRVPLFLGGSDDVANLEKTDLDVYWDISVQLLEQTRGLAPGTPVRSVQLLEQTRGLAPGTPVREVHPDGSGSSADTALE